MAADISVTRLDVVKEYNAKLKSFRAAAVACGAIIDRQIRKIQSDVESRNNLAKSKLGNAKMQRDSLVNRYKKARQITLPGIEAIGDSDHQIETKYFSLEAAVNDYIHAIDDIKAKMAEIGQETKTFCTILDSETLGCTRKLEEMIAHMDEMCKIKL